MSGICAKGTKNNYKDSTPRDKFKTAGIEGLGALVFSDMWIMSSYAEPAGTPDPDRDRPPGGGG
jgi:hypothetical protein